MQDGTFCRGAAEVCLAERLLLVSLVQTALETGRTELGRGRWAVTWSGVTVQGCHSTLSPASPESAAHSPSRVSASPPRTPPSPSSAPDVGFLSPAEQPRPGGLWGVLT